MRLPTPFRAVPNLFSRLRHAQIHQRLMTIMKFPNEDTLTDGTGTALIADVAEEVTGEGAGFDADTVLDDGAGGEFEEAWGACFGYTHDRDGLNGGRGGGGLFTACGNGGDGVGVAQVNSFDGVGAVSGGGFRLLSSKGVSRE